MEKWDFYPADDDDDSVFFIVFKQAETTSKLWRFKTSKP